VLDEYRALISKTVDKPIRIAHYALCSQVDCAGPMPINAAHLRDFAARYAAAWCSHDPARVAEFFSLNGSLTVNDGVPAAGRSAIAEVARSFMTAFPDLTVVMDEVVLRGERAEFHWTLLGTSTGPGGKGRRVRISGFELWEIGSDGLVASSQGHFDSAEYQRQLEHGAEEG
jgi:uncharacterized protein (TIGR02246 family)